MTKFEQSDKNCFFQADCIPVAFPNRLDNKHCAFGQLLAGLDVLRKMEKLGTKAGKPTEKIIITACGEML